MSEFQRPQAKRCRHRTDCAPHHELGLPECLNRCLGACDYFSHKRTCNCKEFAIPSMTLTKIGAAIHIQFPDGTMVDCDLNVPTIPTCTPYDGRKDEVEQYLRRMKPVGWLEEQRRLETLQSAGKFVDTDSWQVKMRRINKNTVLPRQVIVTLISFTNYSYPEHPHTG